MAAEVPSQWKVAQDIMPFQVPAAAIVVHPSGDSAFPLWLLLN